MESEKKQEKKLPSVFGLLGETFAEYKKRWKVFFLVMFFPAIVSLISNLWGISNIRSSSSFFHLVLTTFGPVPGLFISLLDIAIPIFSIILLLWSEVAFILTISNESISLDKIGKVYKDAWKKTGSFTLVEFLFVLICLGGIIFLVFPVVLFSVWFLFSGFIVVLEGKKGLSAFVRSKRYTKGLWWSIFIRFISVAFPTLFFSFFISNRLDTLFFAHIRIVNALYLFFVTPFVILYHYRLYTYVKKICTVPDDYANNTTKGWLSFLIVCSIVFLVLLILISAHSLTTRPIQIMSDGMIPDYSPGQVYATRKVIGNLRRGAVVTLTVPQEGERLEIRRIIGLPGERISLVGGQVFIHGAFFDESSYLSFGMQTHGESFLHDGQTVVIPPEHYFVLADNRTIVSDSRSWGFIPKSAIKSQVLKCLRNCIVFQHSIPPIPSPSASFPLETTPFPTFTCVGDTCSNH